MKLAVKQAAPVFLAIVLFLIRVPPFYLFAINSSYLLSYNLARILIVVLFFYRVFFTSSEKSRFPRILTLLLLFFFFSLSLSVLSASNIQNFLLVYKDHAAALALFVVVFEFFEKKHMRLMINVLIGATILNVLFQLVTYFLPYITYQYIQSFLEPRYWQFLQYQMGRSRFFGESFDETVVPFVFFYLGFGKKFLKRLFLSLIILAILFITFVSNWRTKTLILIFTLVSSSLFYLKRMKKYLFIGVFLILTVFYIANSISLQIIGMNILDRIVYAGEEERSTIQGRFTYWKEGIDMGLSSPVTGVGLGNYYDNLPLKSQLSKLNTSVAAPGRFVVIDDPHNIFISTFTSTGLLGLISLLLLLSHFLYSDMKYLRKKATPGHLFLISFWGLFIFSLFNPWMYFSYLTFFWFLRGVIEKIKILPGK